MALYRSSPDCAIPTDVSWASGETDSDFAETLESPRRSLRRSAFTFTTRRAAATDPPRSRRVPSPAGRFERMDAVRRNLKKR